MELSKAISAILFYYAEPMSIQRLATITKHSVQEVEDAILVLEGRVGDIGLSVIRNGKELTMGTAIEASTLIESITKEELSKDLSKAALETLAIVLYKGPLTRSEIDYIRGVNSTFILRNLLIRGLVEKVENPADQRSFNYKATFQLLEYMGVKNTSDLPDYHDVIAQLGAFSDSKESEKSDSIIDNAPVISGTDEGTNDTENAVEIAEAMEEESSVIEHEADIWEDDTAGGGFNDEQLHDRTNEDRP